MSVSKGIGLLGIALSCCLAAFGLGAARAADGPGCGALPTMQQTVKCLNERRIAEARREAPETVPMWLECADGMEMFARDLDEGKLSLIDYAEFSAAFLEGCVKQAEEERSKGFNQRRMKGAGGKG